MKNVMICLLILAGLAIQPCYSQDKRAEEIKANLLASNDNNAHVDVINRAVTSYPPLVNAGKKTLISVLNSSDDDMEDEWKKRANKQAGLSKAHFQSFISKADGNSELIVAFGKTAKQEEKFWSKVAASEISIWIGAIDALAENLEEKGPSIKSSWAKIQDKSREVGRKADEAIDSIEEADEYYRKTASNAQKTIDLLETAADRLADLTKVWVETQAELPSATALEAIFWSTVNESVKALESGVVQMYARRKINQARYGQDYTIRLYKDTRSEVQQFIKNNNFDLAKKYYSNLNQSIGKLSSSMSTSGQKQIIESMASPIKKSGSDKLSRAEKAYKQIIRDNKERFISALSVNSDVVDQLLQKSKWDQVVRGVKSSDVDDELKSLLDDVKKIESKFLGLLKTEYMTPADKRTVEETLYSFVKAYRKLQDSSPTRQIELAKKHNETMLKKILKN